MYDLQRIWDVWPGLRHTQVRIAILAGVTCAFRNCDKVLFFTRLQTDAKSHIERML